MHSYKFSNVPPYFNMKILKSLFTKYIKEKMKIVYKQGNKYGYLHTELSEIPLIHYKNKEIKFHQVEKDNKRERVEKDNKMEDKIEDIRDKVTPLWNIDYNKQIEMKEENITNFYIENKILSREEIIEINKKYINIKENKEKIIVVPAISFLRNKIELTFGLSPEPALGFRFDRNYNKVLKTEDIQFISNNLKIKIENINSLLKKREILIYNRETKVGYLKILLIKEFNDEIISLLNINCKEEEEIIIRKLIDNKLKDNIKDDNYNINNINEDNIKDNNIDNNIKDDNYNINNINEDNNYNINNIDNINEDNNYNINNIDNINNIIKNLIDFILEIPLKNLYLIFSNDNYDGIPNDKKRIIKIRGEDSIVYNFMDYKFKINLFSFFQSNLTFTRIIEDIKDIIKYKNTLLDLCCGCGVIGILLNKHFKNIIGIENNKECKEMVEFNLKNNNIENYNFILGDIKDIKTLIRKEGISECASDNYIAILDPPRNGVSKSTISWIRDSNINELIYISCDYKQSIQNLKDLMREESKKYKNDKFKIEFIRAYDLFPNTDKAELMIYLKR